MKTLSFKLFTLIVFCMITQIGFSQIKTVEPNKIGLSSERLKRIDNFFNEIVGSKKIGGVVTLISRYNQIGYFKSFGSLDVERKMPMIKDAIIPIGSMTKIITSVAVLQLYEKGLFLLNDPIEKYIPELKDLVVIVDPNQNITDSLITKKTTTKPTIRNFLRHTSGIMYSGRNTITDKLYKEAGFRNWDKSLKEFVTEIGKIPLAFQPGEMWRYSYSHDVLGYLIEIVSGKSLDEYFKENIFLPLEMANADFFVPNNRAIQLSNLYEYSNGELKLMIHNIDSKYLQKPPNFSGGGGWWDSYCGVVCTVEDYYKLCAMLLNYGEYKGNRILSRKSVELMTGNHVGELMAEDKGSGNGYGLGIGVRTSIKKYGELGSDNEVYWAGAPYNTYFWIDYSEKLIGIMFTNTAPYKHLNMMEKFKILILQAIDE
jgi:CubicO group peptidase (beta-lactamase class C family)